MTNRTHAQLTKWPLSFTINSEIYPSLIGIIIWWSGFGTCTADIGCCRTHVIINSNTRSKWQVNQSIKISTHTVEQTLHIYFDT